MTAEILKIEKQEAKDGGFFWYIFFRDKKNQKSYRACVYERFRNFAKWKNEIEENRVGDILSGLNTLQGNIVDADSGFIVEFRPPKAPDVPTVDPVTNNASKRIVATVLCDICNKKIEKEKICQMTINIGGGKDPDVSCGETEDIRLPKEFVTIKIHLKCRDKLYERIAVAKTSDDFEGKKKKEIDAELVGIAKAAKEGEK